MTPEPPRTTTAPRGGAVTDDRTAPVPAARALPDHVTLPLLTRITQQSLEEDYLHVAERRLARARAEGVTGPAPAPPATRRTGWAVAVLALFGVLVTTAAVQTSQNSDVDDASRATLIDGVNTRRDAVASLQDRIAAQRDQIADLDRTLLDLGDAQQAVLARLQRLRTTTGFTEVRGEGVRISVADAPRAGDVELVRADDLRTLVNGLWQAGAEALAINGERLSTLSSFSNTGVAIQVNGAPLSPPYVVEAIGDTATLQARLAQTGSGVTFQALEDRYGFVVSRQNVDDLSLPAAPARQLVLRAVEPVVDAAARTAPETLGKEVSP